MLYRVKVTYEMVVDAPTESAACTEAFLRRLEAGGVKTEAIEINPQFPVLPEGWTPNCVPYGSDDETTIAGYLKKK